MDDILRLLLLFFVFLPITQNTCKIMAPLEDPDKLYSKIQDKIESQEINKVQDKDIHDIKVSIKSRWKDGKHRMYYARIWYVLKQMKLPSPPKEPPTVLNDFIQAGLDDDCLPFDDAEALPQALSKNNSHSFLRLQKHALPDNTKLGESSLIQLDDGDALFDLIRPATYSSWDPIGLPSWAELRYVDITIDNVRVASPATRLTRKLLWRGNARKDGNAVAAQKHEVAILRRIKDHHHIIKLHSTFTDKRCFALLFEPDLDMNLYQYMHNSSNPLMDKQGLLQKSFGCLINAVKHLHESPIGITHNNIRPSKIALKDGFPYLMDFASSFNGSKRVA